MREGDNGDVDVRSVGEYRNFRYEDCYVFLKTISVQFVVCDAIIHGNIHEDPNTRKVCAKLVPEVLTNQKNQRHFVDNREMVDVQKNCLLPSLRSRFFSQ